MQALPRVRSSRPLDRALWLVAAAMTTLIVVDCVLLADNTEVPYLFLVGFTAIGAVYLVAGLVAWRRRPGNRMGFLLCAGGLIYLLVSLANVQLRGLVAVGQLVATVPLALIVHLLLAFPSGRLRSRTARVTVLVGYLVCTVVQLPREMFTSQNPPYDPLFVADRPDLVAIASVVQSVTGAVVMMVTAAILARRLRAATTEQRRVLIPLAAYGIVAVLMLPVGGSLWRALGVPVLTTVLIQMVILAGVPVAFAVSVLRGGFARTGELEDLAGWLSSGAPDRPRLADAVGEALGDPTVTVGYRIDDGEPVDGTGQRIVSQPEPRGQVDVDLDGRRLATIFYDADLITDAEHVARAGRLVAIQLDRERLTAELLAGREELHRSRLRIVQEADRERRRIAQDLHDGLQAQLVVSSLVAGRLAADETGGPAELRGRADDLRRELDRTAADLRRLVHGLMPAILVERGLYAAARGFVDALPVDAELTLDGSDAGLLDVVETTCYFVLAEALTNAVKHARAQRLRVCIDRTPEWLRIEVTDDGIGGAAPGQGGLRGLDDRVRVLGGRLVVDSPPGVGTRVWAEIACVP